MGGSPLRACGLGGAGVLLAGLAGCAFTSLTSNDRRQIQATLDGQAAAWNEGDIERFMEPYWHSPQLTFSAGGQVTRGWEDTFNRYKARYPTPADMGQLRFTDLEVIEIGPRAALVLGRWRLDREKPVGGNFSLVLRKGGGRWIIIHDHTSVESPQ